uniref:Mitochondrial cardiolipin hydrolase n=1 Tax=Phallusia mammillata TaxID=59560 RepID=A0A6F9D8M9_9ASCI|nr:uncharacterized protein C4orf45 [Phallusia mammillata]
MAGPVGNVSLLVHACAAMVIVAETGLIAYRFYVWKKNAKSRKKAVFHKVLFFPDQKIPCQRYLLSPQGCARKNCSYSHDWSSSFAQLMKHVITAKRSIYLCMFSVTCNELAMAVLQKFRQGAVVRVITDTEYMNLNGSRIADFMNQGIEVRHDRSSYLMHHKFLIIDEKVVVTGSFNWTHAAVIGNNENVLVTNHPDVLDPYLAEYKKLWKMFKVNFN